eukprot:scaffold3970_cov125-Skeletonema_marinoi.AAC.6
MRVLLFALSASSVAAFAPSAVVRRTFKSCGLFLSEWLGTYKDLLGFVGWLEAVWVGAISSEMPCPIPSL